MPDLVPPHGGKLVPLLARRSQWQEGIKEAEALRLKSGPQLPFEGK